MYLPGGRASGLSARLTRGDLQFATPGSTGKIYNANPVAFGRRVQKIFFCDVFGFKMSHGWPGRKDCQAAKRCARVLWNNYPNFQKIRAGHFGPALRLPVQVTT